MTRVYVPLALAALRALVADGQLPSGPAYAVTPALRDAYATTGVIEEEDLEYAAMTIAARASLALLDLADPADRRRIVVAADASAEPDGESLGLVRLAGAIGRERIASVHVDTTDAAAAVDAAARVLPTAAEGHPQVGALVEALEDENLAWYAVQELAEVLGSASPRCD